MIYTNLNTDNMIIEIERHLRNITNKDYIKGVINVNYGYKLITKEEKNYLYNKYVGV